MSLGKKHKINQEIDCGRVLLIAENGENKGEVSIGEALAQAISFGLDLIEMANRGPVSVCRISDYNKLKFSGKKTKKVKPKQLKTIKLRPVTDIGDDKTKISSVEKFLSNEHRVLVQVVFRGRELTHKEIGADMLQRVLDDVSHASTKDAKPKLDGRSLSCVLSPLSSKGKKLAIGL